VPDPALLRLRRRTLRVWGTDRWHRLYYQDPQRLAFDAVVTGVTRLDGRPAVALEATAFYPTSGASRSIPGRSETRASWT